MNTTMAPMKHMRQASGELRRRHDSHQEVYGKRTQNITGHMRTEKRNFFQNSNITKNNRNTNYGSRNRFGEGSKHSRDRDGNSNVGSKGRPQFDFSDCNLSSSSSAPRPTAPPDAPPEASSTALPEASPETPPAANAAPTPIDAVPALGVPPVEAPSISPTSTSETAPSSSPPISSPPPIATSPAPSVAVIPEYTLAETSAQPQKELSDMHTSTNASSGLPIFSMDATSIIPARSEAETALSVTSAVHTASPSVSGLGNNNKGPHSISPLAERLLIAVAATGAFIMVLAAIYFIFRARNTDTFPTQRNKIYVDKMRIGNTTPANEVFNQGAMVSLLIPGPIQLSADQRRVFYRMIQHTPAGDQLNAQWGILNGMFQGTGLNGLDDDPGEILILSIQEASTRRSLSLMKWHNRSTHMVVYGPLRAGQKK